MSTCPVCGSELRQMDETWYCDHCQCARSPQHTLARQIESPAPTSGPGLRIRLAVAVIILVLLIAPLSYFALTKQPEVEGEMVTIQDISDIRGLEVLGEVEYRYITEEELALTLGDAIDPDGLEQTKLTLDALFLMDYEEDLESLMLEAYASQVMGYYDFEVKEMVLIERESMSAVDKVTLAHELTHALQDQHFNLTRFLNLSFSDELFAREALVEGDAMTVMGLYMLSLPTDERNEVMAEIEEMAETSPEIPYASEQAMMFPYLQGTEFVLELYLNGGWYSVNAAFDDPPTSTEQIMHPEKYFAGEQPETVEINVTAQGLSLAVDDTLGEFMLFLMLDNHIPSDRASRAAEGWGGDRFHYYANDTDFLSVLAVEWDTEADALEFYNAHGEMLDSLPQQYEDLLRVVHSQKTTTIYYASNPDLIS